MKINYSLVDNSEIKDNNAACDEACKDINLKNLVNHEIEPSEFAFKNVITKYNYITEITYNHIIIDDELCKKAGLKPLGVQIDTIRQSFFAEFKSQDGMVRILTIVFEKLIHSCDECIHEPVCHINLGVKSSTHHLIESSDYMKLIKSVAMRCEYFKQ